MSEITRFTNEFCRTLRILLQELIKESHIIHYELRISEIKLQLSKIEII